MYLKGRNFGGKKNLADLAVFAQNRQIKFPPNLIVIRQIKFPPNLKNFINRQIKFPPNCSSSAKLNSRQI